MRKQLENFLIDLTEIYPLNTSKNFEKVIEEYTDYLLQFCENKEINFKRVKFAVFEKNKFKKYPDFSMLKECLAIGEMTQYQKCKNEGELLVITLPDGRKYQFIVSAVGKNIQDIKSSVKRRFGDCKYDFYPKGTVINGEKVFIPGE